MATLRLHAAGQQPVYVIEDDTAIQELPAWLVDLLDVNLAVRELEYVAGSAGA